MGKINHRPLIAVAGSFDMTNNRYTLPKEYFSCIEGAGGSPLLVPFAESIDKSDEIAMLFDALLLCGGPDADPLMYEEECLPGNGDICPERDLSDVNLINSFFNARKPILAICRGIQMLNVAFGGSLYQDIYSMINKPLQHSQRAPKWYPAHKIEIIEGSFISKCFNGSYSGNVNSFHHQAIKNVAKDFFVTSNTSDGIIESIEYNGDVEGFVAVGVQWHPELMAEKDICQRNIFSKFIDLCK
jgi:putative glutamine amidotransferase